MKKPLLSLPEFIAAIDTLKEPIFSKTGRASYSGLKRTDNVLHFKRDKTAQVWHINLDELYEAYRNLDSINTKTIRKYVTGRVYSPGCAILITLGFYDMEGKRVYY
jgi:hypothetical protein